MFADTATITVRAGNGGNGLVSFRREKYVPAGGPDGGDGGNGGNVVFVADRSLTTLYDFRHKHLFAAKNGEDGKSANRAGHNGEDLIVHVPDGTVIRDKETGLVIADISGEGASVVVAKGGSGGWGNRRFATPTRQAPNFAKNGTKGESFEVTLELKLVADVGLLGFPNAGKSTLLAAVTAAKPKIADYPFTTIEPNLGVVALSGGRSFVIADIPGIIEGAHKGVGLGHDFLRHIERTRLLVHLVDISGFEERDPIADYEAINKELELYNPQLASRPQIVAANKADIIFDEEAYARFRDYLEERDIPWFEISAATKKGVSELMDAVTELLSTLPPVPLYTQEFFPAPPSDETPFTVRVDEEGAYVVEGPLIDRLISGVNFEDDQSLGYFQRALRRYGIIDALEKAGIEEEDTVKMGEDIEFEFMY